MFSVFSNLICVKLICLSLLLIDKVSAINESLPSAILRPGESNSYLHLYLQLHLPIGHTIVYSIINAQSMVNSLGDDRPPY